MLEIFTYGFMVRALLAGALIALTLPLLGSFLVAKRYSLIADSLAHVSLAGVGAGLLLQTSPVYFALPVAVLGALLLEWLRQKRHMSGEVSLALLMSGGLALAIVLASLSSGGRVDFTSYLFGSIATTTWQDVAFLAGAGVLVACFVGRYYRSLVFAAFDEQGAKIAGHKVALQQYVMVAITAGMVVLSLRVVGGLLISALLVIPVVTASQIAKSFRATLFLSVLFALIAVVVGILIAFYAGIAAGGAIVLSALCLLAIVMLMKD